MADPDDAPWLSLTEASQRTGRHVIALRSMVRRDRIESRKGNHGQWLVRLPAELRKMLDALRAELAEARRPWWQRWRG